MDSKNFYCRIKCGTNFSIEEWNKAFRYCNENNIEGKEREEILEGKECTEQCFDCMADVGDRRVETQKLIDNKWKTK